MAEIDIFDGHCDTVLMCNLFGGGFAHNGFHVDLERAGKYRRFAQFFALFGQNQLLRLGGFDAVAVVCVCFSHIRIVNVNRLNQALVKTIDSIKVKLRVPPIIIGLSHLVFPPPRCYFWERRPKAHN